MSRSLSDAVEWVVEPTSPATRALLAARNLTVVAASVVLTGPVADVVPVRERRLPEDGEAVGSVVVTGRAPWLPTIYADEQNHLTLCTDRAVADPTTTHEVEVPLADYLVVEATPLTGDGRRRAHDRWQLRVVGDDVDLLLTGDWLDLAWAGHLACWAEPPR